MIEAGIVGATGYMGGEVLRILLDHPEVRIKWITSRRQENIADVHPNLFGMDIGFIPLEEADACDVVFVALPTAPSLPVIRNFLDRGSKVIDLGAAFRLKNIEDWERVYGMEHPDKDLVGKTPYGIPEFHIEEIRRADLVANPGCFASASIFGLAPLVANKLIDTGHLIVDGMSGTAGAGADLARPAHHPEIGNNLVPYNVVDHRHTYEMEQELGKLTDRKITVHFTPSYVPIVRGILAVCHSFPTKPVDRESLLEVYREFYRDSPFVKVYDLPKEKGVSWQYRPYPWVNTVAGTNYCYIGLDYDEKRNRIVSFSVLDSIGKGGAQAGVENMNIMFGLDRTAGLARRGMHPA